MFKRCFMIDKRISVTSGVIKLVFAGSDQMLLNTLQRRCAGRARVDFGAFRCPPPVAAALRQRTSLHAGSRESSRRGAER